MISLGPLLSQPSLQLNHQLKICVFYSDMVFEYTVISPHGAFVLNTQHLFLLTIKTLFLKMSPRGLLVDKHSYKFYLGISQLVYHRIAYFSLMVELFYHIPVYIFLRYHPLGMGIFLYAYFYYVLPILPMSLFYLTPGCTSHTSYKQ